MNFVAIDFETANSDRSSICSAGFALVRDGALVETKYWLIRPSELRFHPINVSIHGITEKDVHDKPTFAELWDEMKPYIKDNIVLAHNASFDMGCLREVLTKYSLEYPHIDYSCTRNIAKKAFPGLTSYSLSSVSEHLCIDLVHHHAEFDAVACANIAIKACEHHGSRTIHELSDLLLMTFGKLYPGGYIPARLNAKTKSKRCEQRVAEA